MWVFLDLGSPVPPKVTTGVAPVAAPLVWAYDESDEKSSWRRKTFRKTVVAAMTETTRVKGRAMMFMTGLSDRPARMVWIRLLVKAAAK